MLKLLSLEIVVGHIFLITYMCVCFLGQLHVISNNILKQLIIPEYHMGVYQKGGSNANGRTWIFDISHDCVRKVVPEKIKQCFFLAYICIFLILMLTSYRSRTLVRIDFHQQLHPRSHYALDDILQGIVRI